MRERPSAAARIGQVEEGAAGDRGAVVDVEANELGKIGVAEGVGAAAQIQIEPLAGAGDRQKSRQRQGAAFGGALTGLYGVLYGVLLSEDNALLMGSLLMFLALGTVMLTTRLLDWYKLGERRTDADK